MPSNDFNQELHARPSLYFQGFAIVEHIAVRPSSVAPASPAHSLAIAQWDDFGVHLSVERQSEFVSAAWIQRLPIALPRTS